MNRKTICLLRRLLISQKLDQVELIKAMQATEHTDAEIAEVLNNDPKGDEFYVLHGYWNTPQCDGATIIASGYEVEPLEKKLAEIAENKGIEGYCIITGGSFEEEMTKRMYEVTNLVDFSYAKFYISEGVADYEK